VGDSEPAMAIAVPPVQFDHIVKTKIGNQVENMMRNHDGGRHTLKTSGLLHNRAEGWPVQVVEVGVGNQHQVDRGQVTHLQTWPSNPFQDEEPARKVGIDDDILAADLEKETGVPDECQAQLAIGHQLWFMGAAGPGSDYGMAYQAAELPGTLAKRGILERILQHLRRTRSQSHG
jgi:hypothetical protein